MAETKFATVDILTEATVNGKVYTPQEKIVPESVAKQLVEQKKAVIIKPNDELTDVQEKVEKTVAAAEKAANK